MHLRHHRPAPRRRQRDRSLARHLVVDLPALPDDDKPASPIVIARADFSMPDGSENIRSSPTAHGPGARPSTTTGGWNFMHFGGEFVRCRAKDNASWCLHPTSTIPSGSRRRSIEPGSQISRRHDRAEPPIQEPIRPSRSTSSNPASTASTWARNFAGWSRPTCAAGRATTITFQFSEREEADDDPPPAQRPA